MNAVERLADSASFTHSDIAYLEALESNAIKVPADDQALAVRVGRVIVGGVVARPTDVGVAGVVRLGLGNGFSIDETKSYIVAAVTAYRPDLLPVLRHYYRDVSPPSVSWPSSRGRSPATSTITRTEARIDDDLSQS